MVNVIFSAVFCGYTSSASTIHIQPLLTISVCCCRYFVKSPGEAFFFVKIVIFGLLMLLMICPVLSVEPVSVIKKRETKGKTELTAYQTNRSSFLTIMQAVILSTFQII